MRKRTYYTKKDLLSFGAYLLGEIRSSSLLPHQDAGTVHPADFENWRTVAEEVPVDAGELDRLKGLAE